MVDLLVLTSLDQFHFKLKILIYICFAKQAALMRRSAVLVLKVSKLYKLKCLSLLVLSNIYNDGKFQLSTLCEVPYNGHTRLLGLH
jgi:hypothetical protein